ncbi:MAG: hypothetical protein K2P37_04850 [Oscillospiraceae bacterium]|nr:hypothetical protein [Oscillospiraceae bacterium]
MKIRIVWALAAVCLLLAGCRRAEPETPPEPSPPPASVQPEEDQPAEKPRPLFLESLSVEVMVDWEDADRMLGSLDELSRLLDSALEEAGCTLGEPATVTIGTAGGITAQALADGGVDVAFLPAEDLLTTEEDAAVGVLMNTDQDFFLAASTGREELDEHFRFLLEEALTMTEDGQAFLETCYPGVEFIRAVERPAES